MYTKILGVLAVSASLMMSQSVLADSSRCTDQLRSMVVGSLKLTDSQREKIKPVLEQLKTSAKDHFTQMRDIRAKIRQQIESDTMDQATVDSLVDQKAKLVTDFTKARISARHEVFTVLTPEQKTKLKTEMQNVEDRLADRASSCQEEG